MHCSWLFHVSSILCRGTAAVPQWWHVHLRMRHLNHPDTQTIQVGWGFAVLLSPKNPCMVYRYSTHIPYKKINKSLWNTTGYLLIINRRFYWNLNTEAVVFQRVLGEVIRSSTWFPTAALRSQEGQQRFQPRICRRHVLGWSPIHRFTDDANGSI